ncbi:MAG TPA: hypothetical protein VJJ23_06165 [Candidatus Nanoarchaeia archaeon]|nr:hypothetical protein [Candidatus Nanoarchaeia archaeon]
MKQKNTIALILIGALAVILLTTGIVTAQDVEKTKEYDGMMNMHNGMHNSKGMKKMMEVHMKNPDIIEHCGEMMEE